MKTWKHYAFVGYIAILVFVFALSCDENKLNGTWTWRHENGFYQVFVFSGRNYTTTAFFGEEMFFKGTYSLSDGNIEFFPRNGEKQILPFSRSGDTITIDGTLQYTREQNQRQRITSAKAKNNDPRDVEGLSGTWECDVWGDSLTFSGRNFNWDGYIGTYSISDNHIEFNVPNAGIRVYQFVRTENTLTLSRPLSSIVEYQFIRRR